MVCRQVVEQSSKHINRPAVPDASLQAKTIDLNYFTVIV